MNKEKFDIEYVLGNVSRSSLWNHVTTSRGLSSWFAEKVSVKNNIYTFMWHKDEMKARAEVIKPKERIRYFPEAENDIFPSYIEFSIHTQELTGTTSLRVTDFAEAGEKKDAIDLWNSQIQALKRSLGI